MVDQSYFAALAFQFARTAQRGPSGLKKIEAQNHNIRLLKYVEIEGSKTLTRTMLKPSITRSRTKDRHVFDFGVPS